MEKQKPFKVESFQADKVLQKHIGIETARQPVKSRSWGIRSALRRAFRLKGGGKP